MKSNADWFSRQMGRRSGKSLLPIFRILLLINETLDSNILFIYNGILRLSSFLLKVKVEKDLDCNLLIHELTRISIIIRVNVQILSWCQNSNHEYCSNPIIHKMIHSYLAPKDMKNCSENVISQGKFHI